MPVRKWMWKLGVFAIVKLIFANNDAEVDLKDDYIYLILLQIGFQSSILNHLKIMKDTKHANLTWLIHQGKKAWLTWLKIFQTPDTLRASSSNLEANNKNGYNVDWKEIPILFQFRAVNELWHLISREGRRLFFPQSIWEIYFLKESFSLKPFFNALQREGICISTFPNWKSVFRCLLAFFTILPWKKTREMSIGQKQVSGMLAGFLPRVRTYFLTNIPQKHFKCKNHTYDKHQHHFLKTSIKW